MSSLNKILIIGRLGKEVENKPLDNGGHIASFSVATTENWKDKSGERQERTTWHNVTAFGKLAEICIQYLRKGSLVYIEGRIQVDQYEKEGVTMYSTKVIANQMTMLGSKAENESAKPTSARIPDESVPF